MRPEIEDLMRQVILKLYEENQDTGDKSYLDMADEINAIILKMRDGD
jgi:hypothetical protein